MPEGLFIVEKCGVPVILLIISFKAEALQTGIFGEIVIEEVMGRYSDVALMQKVDIGFGVPG